MNQAKLSLPELRNFMDGLPHMLLDDAKQKIKELFSMPIVYQLLSSGDSEEAFFLIHSLRVFSSFMSVSVYVCEFIADLIDLLASLFTLPPEDITPAIKACIKDFLMMFYNVFSAHEDSDDMFAQVDMLTRPECSIIAANRACSLVEILVAFVLAYEFSTALDMQYLSHLACNVFVAYVIMPVFRYESGKVAKYQHGSAKYSLARHFEKNNHLHLLHFLAQKGVSSPSMCRILLALLNFSPLVGYQTQPFERADGAPSNAVFKPLPLCVEHFIYYPFLNALAEYTTLCPSCKRFSQEVIDLASVSFTDNVSNPRQPTFFRCDRCYAVFILNLMLNSLLTTTSTVVGLSPDGSPARATFFKTVFIPLLGLIMTIVQHVENTSFSLAEKTLLSASDLTVDKSSESSLRILGQKLMHLGRYQPNGNISISAGGFYPIEVDLHQAVSVRARAFENEFSTVSVSTCMEFPLPSPFALLNPGNCLCKQYASLRKTEYMGYLSGSVDIAEKHDFDASILVAKFNTERILTGVREKLLQMSMNSSGLYEQSSDGPVEPMYPVDAEKVGESNDIIHLFTTYLLSVLTEPLVSLTLLGTVDTDLPVQQIDVSKFGHAAFSPKSNTPSLMCLLLHHANSVLDGILESVVTDTLEAVTITSSLSFILQSSSVFLQQLATFIPAFFNQIIAQVAVPMGASGNGSIAVNASLIPLQILYDALLFFQRICANVQRVYALLDGSLNSFSKDERTARSQNRVFVDALCNAAPVWLVGRAPTQTVLDALFCSPNVFAVLLDKAYAETTDALADTSLRNDMPESRCSTEYESEDSMTHPAVNLPSKQTSETVMNPAPRSSASTQNILDYQRAQDGVLSAPPLILPDSSAMTFESMRRKLLKNIHKFINLPDGAAIGHAAGTASAAGTCASASAAGKAVPSLPRLPELSAQPGPPGQDGADSSVSLAQYDDIVRFFTSGEVPGGRPNLRSVSKLDYINSYGKTSASRSKYGALDDSASATQMGSVTGLTYHNYSDQFGGSILKIPSCSNEYILLLASVGMMYTGSYSILPRVSELLDAYLSSALGAILSKDATALLLSVGHLTGAVTPPPLSCLQSLLMLHDTPYTLRYYGSRLFSAPDMNMTRIGLMVKKFNSMFAREPVFSGYLARVLRTPVPTHLPINIEVPSIRSSKYHFTVVSILATDCDSLGLTLHTERSLGGVLPRIMNRTRLDPASCASYGDFLSISKSAGLFGLRSPFPQLYEHPSLTASQYLIVQNDFLTLPELFLRMAHDCRYVNEFGTLPFVAESSDECRYDADSNYSSPLFRAIRQEPFSPEAMMYIHHKNCELYEYTELYMHIMATRLSYLLLSIDEHHTELLETIRCLETADPGAPLRRTPRPRDGSHGTTTSSPGLGDANPLSKQGSPRKHHRYHGSSSITVCNNRFSSHNTILPRESWIGARHNTMLCMRGRTNNHSAERGTRGRAQARKQRVPNLCVPSFSSRTLDEFYSVQSKRAADAADAACAAGAAPEGAVHDDSSVRAHTPIPEREYLTNKGAILSAFYISPYLFASLTDGTLVGKSVPLEAVTRFCQISSYCADSSTEKQMDVGFSVASTKVLLSILQALIWNPHLAHHRSLLQFACSILRVLADISMVTDIGDYCTQLILTVFVCRLVCHIDITQLAIMLAICTTDFDVGSAADADAVSVAFSKMRTLYSIDLALGKGRDEDSAQASVSSGSTDDPGSPGAYTFSVVDLDSQELAVASTLLHTDTSCILDLRTRRVVVLSTSSNNVFLVPFLVFVSAKWYLRQLEMMVLRLAKLIALLDLGSVLAYGASADARAPASYSLPLSIKGLFNSPTFTSGVSNIALISIATLQNTLCCTDGHLSFSLAGTRNTHPRTARPILQPNIDAHVKSLTASLRITTVAIMGKLRIALEADGTYQRKVAKQKANPLAAEMFKTQYTARLRYVAASFLKQLRFYQRTDFMNPNILNSERETLLHGILHCSYIPADSLAVETERYHNTLKQLPDCMVVPLMDASEAIKKALDDCVGIRQEATALSEGSTLGPTYDITQSEYEVHQAIDSLISAHILAHRHADGFNSAPLHDISLKYILTDSLTLLQR